MRLYIGDSTRESSPRVSTREANWGIRKISLSHTADRRRPAEALMQVWSGAKAQST